METDEFIKEAKKVHNNKYEYKIDGNIVLSKDKITAICPIHGEFQTNAYEHIRHKRGCRKCASIESNKDRKLSVDKFIKKAKEIHGDKYDYSKVKYVDNHTKIIITCPVHGDFEQTPNSHLNGRGCPECSKISTANKLKYSTEEFIQKAREKHGNKYDYSKVEYKNNKTKVCIICPEHGEAYITPSNHLKGCGCPKCRYVNMSKLQMMTTEEFIYKANKLHNNKYDYSYTEYKGYEIPVKIICPEHGEFLQTPDCHLHSGGCPKCGSTLSKSEDEILNFIKEHINNEDIVTRNRQILQGKEIDIYLSNPKIGIEYNGLVWHSERFGKDKNYHLDKLNKCNEKRIRLIQIFEDEYVYHKEIVLSKIAHILHFNLYNKKIAGRKCYIKEISKSEAKGFLEENHIQGYSPSTVYLGAFYEAELIAVMTFKKLLKCKENWELNRFASKINYLCQGVAGKIFKYFIRKYNPSTIKSFADRRWTSDIGDTLYTKLGFEFDSYVKPTYYYIINKADKYKRSHKFNFRKSILSKKYGLPMDMTENEMAEKLGIYKIWDCGLIKYVWNNSLKQ